MRASGASLPVALVLLLGAAPAARAAELLGEPVRVNPKSDQANSILSWEVVADEKNGFAVLWSKADQLFARFFRSNLKPYGGPIRYDAKVASAQPDGVALFGSAMLGGGKLVSVWQATFAGAPAEGVIQAFDEQKPDGKPKSVENDDDANMLFAKELGDGRAVVPWIANGATSDVSGRFVQANGKLGPANLTFTLGTDSFFPTLYALDKGLLAAAFRPDKNGNRELAGQVYDAKGNKEGGPFVLAPYSGVFQQVANVVGLASGNIALTICQQDGAAPCDLKGQIFRRNGSKSGPAMTLVKGFGPATVALTALDKSGFLLTSAEGDADAVRLVFRRFDDRLKPVGKAAKTKPRAGLRRGGVRLLGDGSAAASYLVNGSSLYVQIVKP